MISRFLQNACATQEELSANQVEIETLEQSLKEKLSIVEELTEERRSLQGTVKHLKSKMDESLRNQVETIDTLK